MLRADFHRADGRAVWVTPHPPEPEEGVALIARLQAQDLPLIHVSAKVHDLLAAAGATVSVNSAAAIKGLSHRMPAILFGRTDMHFFVKTVTLADDVPAAPTIHPKRAWCGAACQLTKPRSLIGPAPGPILGCSDDAARRNEVKRKSAGSVS